MIPGHQADKRILVLRQPVGVVRRHHTLELPLGHDHPQGRPGAGRRLHAWSSSRPTQTPFSALALAELADRAGIPAGVFNVRHRDRPPPSAGR